MLGLQFEVRFVAGSSAAAAAGRCAAVVHGVLRLGSLEPVGSGSEHDQARPLAPTRPRATRASRRPVIPIPSGTEAYNMALSLRRANAVKDALVREGVPATAIAVVGRGEQGLLVQTGPNVREPQNRRVEIVIQQAGRPETRKRRPSRAAFFFAWATRTIAGGWAPAEMAGRHCGMRTVSGLAALGRPLQSMASEILDFCCPDAINGLVSLPAHEGAKPLNHGFDARFSDPDRPTARLLDAAQGRIRLWSVLRLHFTDVSGPARARRWRLHALADPPAGGHADHAGRHCLLSPVAVVAGVCAPSSLWSTASPWRTASMDRGWPKPTGTCWQAR